MNFVASSWLNLMGIAPRSMTCGYCGHMVSSEKGWSYSGQSLSVTAIYVCPHCGRPTSFLNNVQIPGVSPGSDDVAGVPADTAAVYDEARRSLAAGSPTASVLACRKLMMHVAVGLGAPPKGNFVDFIQHIADQHYLPPNAQPWVDLIRKKGNEANHEIKLMSVVDATELLLFAEMLLRIVYEFPSKVPPPPAPATP